MTVTGSLATLAGEADTDEATHRAAFIAQMRMVPGAVAIIATADGDDRTGLAATAWNSVCADPPTLLVCINRNASAHAVIKRGRWFSVSLLATDHAETVALFSGQRGLSGAARFKEDEWFDGPGGQPMFRSAVTSFECKLQEMHEYGTHSVLIGNVTDMRCRTNAEALLYLDGSFASALRLG